MISTPEMDAFLREGFDRYIDATDAVEAFENEIHSRFINVFEEKVDWQHFRPMRGVEGCKREKWRGATGRTVHVTQYAETGPTSIDLKLWWHSPRYQDRVLLCCGFWNKYTLQPINITNAQPPIVFGSPDHAKPRLYVVIDAETNLQTTARLLLNTMDQALRK